MRQIVYFWISNYKNIKNQGFNFGSEYEYSTEIIEEKTIISRKENLLYLPDFFHSTNSDSILNITAIVGENGCGKSTFLDALKHALTGDRDWFNYVLIYKTEKGGVFTQANIESKLYLSFEESEPTSEFTETIYYNPALDNKIYPITHDSNSWIDISTDWLLYKDSEEQKRTKPEISQIELFGAEEIERQLRLSNDSAFVDFLKNRINIPNEIRIVSVSGDYPPERVRNVPYSYRPYYETLDDMANVVNDYAQKEDEIQKERKIQDNINPYTRKKCYATFLNHLLKNLFYHFESTNHFLRKGEIKTKIEELKKLDYEDAVVEFIRNIDLIENTDVVVEFIEYTKELILNSKVEFSSFGEVSWISPKVEINEFIKLKDKYLIQLNKFANYNSPRSFINYTWPGLSTGEKAMLNLYSRFYSVKTKIIKKIESNNHQKLTIPNMLYILIDEGELGFHLQWQKEYINDLVNYLPQTLILEKDGKPFNPNIQIIFTTHSTLSLSDIPSSNITYLKKSNGLAYVLHDQEKPTKSFGANFHSLVSDSFFIENGLVGSFATQKINSIIKLINSANLSESDLKYVKSIIQIIDEPLLRKKLISMLSEKHAIETELEKLELLKNEIESRINQIKKR
jgi:energy-coupling factor transporter ATP-binding protein EcfA2